MAFRTRAAWAVALLSVASSAAQESTDGLFARTLSTREAFATWSAAHGPGWQLAIDERTGCATFVGGGRSAPLFAPATDAELFELARMALAETADMTGIEPGTLVEERVKLLPLGMVGTTDKLAVRFRQEVAGVPVLAGFANVLLDLRGGLLALQSTALPGVASLSTRAELAAGEAARLALAAFGAQSGLPGEVVRGPRLAIAPVEVGRRLAPALVWEVDVQWHRPGALPEGLVLWVDARGGGILGALPSVHEFDVGGTLLTQASPGTAPDTPANPETPLPVAHARISSAVGTTYTDAAGQFNFPGVAGSLDLTVEYVGTFVDVDDVAGPDHVEVHTVGGPGNSVVMNAVAPEAVTAQANAYRHVVVLREWVRSVDPTDGTADFQALARVNHNSTCNAYFDGSSVNFFASGGGCVNTAYASVVAHEMGHWLNVLYGTGNGSDGMGEGNADVFSMYVYDTPLVGEDFFGPGTNVRTGLNTTMFCGDCCPGCHGGGVHKEGEVWMGAAWKLRERLNASQGNALGDDISNALFSGWLHAYDQVQIKSVIEIQWLTLDDDNGNIEDGTPRYFDIDQGFRDQGFPGYDLPAILFEEVTQLPDTIDELGPYTVDAVILAQQSPPIALAELHWRIGGGSWQNVTMVNSGANDFTGDIPGQISPVTVEYYLLAQDGMGNVRTFPEQAPDDALVFNVGVLHLLIHDDFETDDDGGWTHGSNGDTGNDHDDFRHGVPAGLVGDPDQAASGTRVWGNDLGDGSWNGLYQNNQHNWLRSPVIDCSAATNVELRFQRWLTVEKGQRDRAYVLVNGVEVWANDPNEDHVDVEWVAESIDVSAIADGDPAVQVEFGLESDAEIVFGGWNVDDFELRYLTPVGGAVGTAICFGDGSGTPCPCGNEGLAGEGCANSTGSGALLTATGSASVAADDLLFEAANLLPNQPALLFVGENAVNGGDGIPFGDGLRCVGANVHRLGVQSPSGGGAASWGPGLSGSGGWAPGDTRHVQCWYRDPSGGPCSTGFNLSHALSVDFLP